MCYLVLIGRVFARHLSKRAYPTITHTKAKGPLAAHCPLSTAHCPLPTVHCPLSTAHCPLNITNIVVYAQRLEAFDLLLDV